MKRVIRKTYVFQTKRDSSLYCKLFILPNDYGKVEQLVCMEVYNHGNTPARNITITLNGDALSTVDYIRPEDREVLLVGQVHRMIGCNRVFIRDAEIKENSKVPVTISVNNNAPNELLLQTTALFLHSTTVHNEDERIAEATENINQTLEKAFDSQYVGTGHGTFRDELTRIADAISKKNG